MPKTYGVGSQLRLGCALVLVLVSTVAQADLASAVRAAKQRESSLKSLSVNISVQSERSDAFFSQFAQNRTDLAVRDNQELRWKFKNGKELQSGDLEGAKPNTPFGRQKETIFTDANTSSSLLGENDGKKAAGFVGSLNGPPSLPVSPLTFGYRVDAKPLSEFLESFTPNRIEENEQEAVLEYQVSGKTVTLTLDARQQYFPKRLSVLGNGRRTVFTSTATRLMDGLPVATAGSVEMFGPSEELLIRKKYKFKDIEVNKVRGELSLKLPEGAMMKDSKTQKVYRVGHNGNLIEIDLNRFRSKRPLIFNYLFIAGAVTLSLVIALKVLRVARGSKSVGSNGR